MPNAELRNSIYFINQNFYTFYGIEVKRLKRDTVSFIKSSLINRRKNGRCKAVSIPSPITFRNFKHLHFSPPYIKIAERSDINNSFHSGGSIVICYSVSGGSASRCLIQPIHPPEFTAFPCMQDFRKLPDALSPMQP